LPLIVETSAEYSTMFPWAATAGGLIAAPARIKPTMSSSRVDARRIIRPPVPLPAHTNPERTAKRQIVDVGFLSYPA
jgi:hypothetical protein